MEGPTSSSQFSLTWLAEGGAGLPDLAVDGQLEQVLELVLVEPLPDEVELDGRLLDALGEVPLVEGEAELSVLEHVVGAGFVISSACGLVHGGRSIFAHERTSSPDSEGLLNDRLQQKGTQRCVDVCYRKAHPARWSLTSPAACIVA